MLKQALVVMLLAALVPACSRSEKTPTEQAEAKRVEPAPQEKLSALLPDLNGWEATAPQGELKEVGEAKISVASRQYQQGGDPERRITLTITDGVYVSSVYSPIALLSHSTGGPGDVHKMRLEVKGHSGVQDWKPEKGTVTAHLMVARRFMVSLHGKNAPPAVVNQLLNSMDLDTLAGFAAGDGQPPLPNLKSP